MLPSATSLCYGLSREQVRVMVVENPRRLLYLEA
jgi:hypothetical protein